MPGVPVLRSREVIAILARHGFVEVRQRGSHKQFRHADGRATTVPVHAGRDISPILLRQIAKDIGLAIDEFLKHR
jgi:predicted RNA binding protein YcfA (HicA-like mRNA interferase family)